MKKSTIFFCLLLFFAHSQEFSLITISLKNIKNNLNGNIRIYVFSKDNEDAYPSQPEKAEMFSVILKQDLEQEMSFQLSIAKGSYGILVFHDINGDEKLNRSWLGFGKPTEGFGSSGKINTLNFDAAVVEVKPGDTIDISLTYP